MIDDLYQRNLRLSFSLRSIKTTMVQQIIIAFYMYLYNNSVYSSVVVRIKYTTICKEHIINAQRACARGLQYSLCVCVCVSAVFWLHQMFIQHFDSGNRLFVKRKRFSTHGFL